MRSIRTPRELPLLILLLLGGAIMAVGVPAHLLRSVTWNPEAFRSAGNLKVVGENAASIGVMACGEAVVILSGGLDLSVGAILALSSCAAATALAAGWAWLPAAAAGLAVG